MGAIFSRLMTIVVGLSGTAVATFFLIQTWKLLKLLPENAPPVAMEAEAEGGHGAPAEHGGGEHGAPAEHGGAEHAAAEQGGGEHGDKAGGHGATAEAGQKADRDVASLPRSWVSLDQLFVNLTGKSNEEMHSLSIQMDLELFDEMDRPTLEGRIAMVKSAAIEVAREQTATRLSTLAGKLYFKESMISAMNQALGAPIVRDIHTRAFFLR